MASESTAENPTDNTRELILEARRQGETYIATQMQVAIAADQRAMTLGSILAAASSVLLGFVVLSVISPATFVVFALLSLMMAIGCGLAFYSARPVLILPPGNVPASWYEDIESNIPATDAYRADLGVIQRTIESNSALLAANGKILTWAMRISGSAVVAAPILTLIAQAARCQ